MNANEPAYATAIARRLENLDRDTALALLATAGFGRVVFTQHALPAIRPVNHLVDNGQVIIRTRLSAAVSRAAGEVVAYEADDLDAVRRLGWSVVVTGTARTVDDPDRVARLERTLHPWVDQPMNTIIAIDTELVTGVRFVGTTPD
ncbi:pyridoxamine 5'-phosphate oxidase family protein [Kribbella shirazensis]|uniref:Nitroimidazol reductase NimA-like FMN-containing flavoprotein (Pyridoxamine 5'-phosphate oxidase superfamily) n=1 Tax=Kribbella shirazensis TaxID=1105143 RepID=A0A7X6A3A1_9ACTN|nr:pyridoxamine 5'-phosphate oxidase family protein [Kribbella shirazensis]NIK59119.1 nitroimidazol reductase NimA-like FMN-containing flavoprotein (pyridoxamine 5'-phosphate oxidase superfamily) [Kribbella shirazensis]